MKLTNSKSNRNLSLSNDFLTLMDQVGGSDLVFFDEPHFNHMLRVERMRAQRSKKPFLLLLIDISRLIETATSDVKVIDKVNDALKPSLREIDIRGWYHNNRTIGVLLTEIASIDASSNEAIINKISGAFRKKLSPGWIRKIDVSYLIP